MIGKTKLDGRYVVVLSNALVQCMVPGSYSTKEEIMKEFGNEEFAIIDLVEKTVEYHTNGLCLCGKDADPHTGKCDECTLTHLYG